MKISIVRWHKGKKEPEQDGRYLVMTTYRKDVADTVYFTVKGGWNTYTKSDGEPDEIRSKKDREDWCNKIILWAELPKDEGIINVP